MSKTRTMLATVALGNRCSRRPAFAEKMKATLDGKSSASQYQYRHR